jgi:hypothetical protein
VGGEVVHAAPGHGDRVEAHTGLPRKRLPSAQAIGHVSRQHGEALGGLEVEVRIN